MRFTPGIQNSFNILKSTKVTHRISRIKNKTHTIILTDSKNYVTKRNKPEIEASFINVIKTIYVSTNLTSYLMVNGHMCSP